MRDVASSTPLGWSFNATGYADSHRSLGVFAPCHRAHPTPPPCRVGVGLRFPRRHDGQARVHVHLPLVHGSSLLHDESISRCRGRCSWRRVVPCRLRLQRTLRASAPGRVLRSQGRRVSDVQCHTRRRLLSAGSLHAEQRSGWKGAHPISYRGVPRNFLLVSGIKSSRSETGKKLRVTPHLVSVVAKIVSTVEDASLMSDDGLPRETVDVILEQQCIDERDERIHIWSTTCPAAMDSFK